MSTQQPSADEPTFWRRQFAARPTIFQIVFDVSFGIMLPLICLYYDPIVFQSSIDRPLMAGNNLVVGGAIGIGLISLSVWLLTHRLAALFSGLLAGGAIFAFMLGVVLLPLSLIGLAVIIGILGFSPFLTCFVFWRNAVRAFRRSQIRVRTRNLMVGAGLAIALAVPLAAQYSCNYLKAQALQMINSTDEREAERGRMILRKLYPLAGLDELVLEYAEEEDVKRQEELSALYFEITGQPIRDQLRLIVD